MFLRQCVENRTGHDDKPPEKNRGGRGFCDEKVIHKLRAYFFDDQMDKSHKGTQEIYLSLIHI